MRLLDVAFDIRWVGQSVCGDLGLHILHEALGGLEGGNVVGGNLNGLVLENVPARLLRTALDDETAETAEIDVVSTFQRIPHGFHKRLNCRLYVLALNTCLVGDAAHEVRLCHLVVSHLAG